MKKILAILLAALSFTVCFSSCNSHKSEAKLSYGVKYIYSEHASLESSEQSYYIFEKNGYGRYHRYTAYKSSDLYYIYTITFKYAIVESEATLVCFYDSIEYHELDSYKTDRSTWTSVILYSEKFIMGSEGGIYIQEKYIKEELTNFGK